MKLSRASRCLGHKMRPFQKSVATLYRELDPQTKYLTTDTLSMISSDYDFEAYPVLPTHPEVTPEHYSDVIMSVIASLITDVSIVYSTISSGANQRKHQTSASLSSVRGIHRKKGRWRGKCFRLMTSSWNIANKQWPSTYFFTKCNDTWTKLPELYIQHFQMDFLERRLLEFNTNFTKLFPKGPVGNKHWFTW